MTDASDTPPSTSATDDPDEKRAGPANQPDAEIDEEIKLEDLSLPEKTFVAVVQNPTRGALVGLLLLFGFSFYIALWFVFPRVAILLSGLAVVMGGLIAAVLFLLR